MPLSSEKLCRQPVFCANALRRDDSEHLARRKGARSTLRGFRPSAAEDIRSVVTRDDSGPML